MNLREQFMDGLARALGSSLVIFPLLLLFWFLMGHPSAVDLAEAIGRGIGSAMTQEEEK